MTAGVTSDEALMAAVRGGTVGLLGVLFERHAGLLHGFFRRRGFAGGGADDLVQEVFLRVLRYRASWRGDGAFAGWLWRFAANVANDALLRERRGNEIARAVAARVARSSDPAAGPARLEETATLHSALARLPADDRQLIEWRWFAGLDAAEIGARRGCSAGAARVRLHRAMVRLRALHGAPRHEER